MSTAPQAKLWSNFQAAVVALLCLAVGTAAGYLLRSPQPKPGTPPQASQTAGPLNSAIPTADQLKHMADKQAEPLLAVLQKNPDDANALAQLGSIYFRTRQFPVAADYYSRAAKIKPNAETLVSLSNAYHYAGTDDRAFEALNHALSLDPKCANALFNLGMLKWQVNNDPKGAVEAWQRLLRTNPNHPRRAQVENMIARARQHMEMPAGATAGVQ